MYKRQHQEATSTIVADYVNSETRSTAEYSTTVSAVASTHGASTINGDPVDNAHESVTEKLNVSSAETTASTTTTFVSINDSECKKETETTTSDVSASETTEATCSYVDHTAVSYTHLDVYKRQR